MQKIENMPLQPSTICLFFQENPLCSYIRIGNHVRVKSLVSHTSVLTGLSHVPERNDCVTNP